MERLAYTRQQAAEALGISTSTFNRRVLPFIDTLQMDWGTRLIPVDELERVLTERRQQARAQRRPPARPGRKTGLPPEIPLRIQGEHANGKSLGEIARGLNSDGVKPRKVAASGGLRPCAPFSAARVRARRLEPTLESS